MKFKGFFLMIMLAVVLAACSNSKAAAPVEIKANEDSCDACKMGIEDLQSAGQIIMDDGKPLLFDDIGCMIDYIQTHNPAYEAAFVHDYQSKEWIDFDKSTFVQDSGIESPMSYGIAAFEVEENANEFHQNHGGMKYTHDELIKIDLKSIKKGDMEHGH
ncbi:copper chaperone NosL [Cytobacillus eiseniae]|uniref:Copper chaperone NosL n=1 Tax=Cytobacillus eiseniae TaxID=762947 RepID=A0ABS4RBF7_9BACI|nr:nitrous oxide reductase accessory protein NosL [Cytobacillus eiseniae]MBP2239669.1 copper chaperone NosL [Cytobacillus eiseniae]